MSTAFQQLEAWRATLDRREAELGVAGAAVLKLISSEIMPAVQAIGQRHAGDYQTAEQLGVVVKGLSAIATELRPLAQALLADGRRAQLFQSLPGLVLHRLQLRERHLRIRRHRWLSSSSARPWRCSTPGARRRSSRAVLLLSELRLARGLILLQLRERRARGGAGRGLRDAQIARLRAHGAPRSVAQRHALVERVERDLHEGRAYRHSLVMMRAGLRVGTEAYNLAHLEASLKLGRLAPSLEATAIGGKR